MKLKIPSSYVLLFYIIIVLGLATYIVPAGSFDREIDTKTGINYVIPNSYQEIEKTPVSVFQLFKAIPQGMMEASDIIIFVLLTGGSFGIIQATGTINAIIGSLVRKYIGKEKMLIPILMIIFSLAGAVFGTAEEALPLYPMVIALATALGFDRITGVAIILLGTGAGFVAGFLNPFTTGIAQSISELPIFSGIFMRIICYLVFLSTSIIYVYRHANNNCDKLQLNGNIKNFNIHKVPTLSSEHKKVMVVTIISFIFLIIGIANYEFYILEISTTFLIMGIACGIVGGLNPGRISSEFVKGASSLTYGALIIGIAKAVSVIMIYGNIMDTIIYNLLKPIEGFAPTISATGMFIVQSIINIFISSGSGQAAATMPIMKTLADMSGITRQTAVLAFQFGDGFSNIISPTSGYFVAALAIGRIEWKEWTKWVLPLFIIWCILGWILIVISYFINYGPF
ncbi:Uncharacterized membrane protein YfcC, ion transporter superfamily [Anaerovirgula multivorans]|uniref:Uncharacterized membrane protein YfcC, ion transporter superfamily n=1 Tax=Anaerovirgula multivorans TaxID=312168 RepID=A0A239GDJ9_9FIRM|nr:AbgT family transporter [Anaerovirgula multivorans]SNS67121.1 Uncharacterized membrane protein YfcC, ion transporter superfamily [Anaerovirgula multivorans]